MNFKQFLVEGLTWGAILNRIVQIKKSTSKPASSGTCWNQVGLYLRAHPETKGKIYFYGERDPEYVNHAILTDPSGKILKDALGTRGRMSPDHKIYFHGDDELELIHVQDL